MHATSPSNTHLDARVDWRNAGNEADWVEMALHTIVHALQRDLAAQPRALLLLSGGSTPAPVYRALSRIDLDWARIDVALVDDRWVAPDAAASNEKLARATLLREHAAAATFWPLVGDTSSAAVEISMQAAVDRANTQWHDAGWQPSIAVLGMGDDGHTASLFPGSRGLDHALATPDPYAAIDAHGCPVAGDNPWRLTLTAAGLAAARQRLLLLRGESKRALLARAAAPGAIEELPVRAAFAGTLDVLWCA